jgi:hypothetical protein
VKFARTVFHPRSNPTTHDRLLFDQNNPAAVIASALSVINPARTIDFFTAALSNETYQARMEAWRIS